MEDGSGGDAVNYSLIEWGLYWDRAAHSGYPTHDASCCHAAYLVCMQVLALEANP
jgi:hypothetical protein